jgi:hypothetical protein
MRTECFKLVKDRKYKRLYILSLIILSMEHKQRTWIGLYAIWKPNLNYGHSDRDCLGLRLIVFFPIKDILFFLYDMHKTEAHNKSASLSASSQRT